MLEDTGCAAVAVGRAALGNPWVFGDILRGAPRPRPGLREVVEEVAAFASDACLALGEERACGYLRKFYPWYLAGYPVSAPELAGLLTIPTRQRGHRPPARPRGVSSRRLITDKREATFRRR